MPTRHHREIHSIFIETENTVSNCWIISYSYPVDYISHFVKLKKYSLVEMLTEEMLT